MLSRRYDPVLVNGMDECEINLRRDEDKRRRETKMRWSCALLPFTVRVAVLLLSPVSQVYSPLSFTFSLCTTRMWVAALCSILYFSPWASAVEPFSQVTLQSRLDVSQDRVASSPSVASWLSSSFLNSTGAAARKTNISFYQWFKSFVGQTGPLQKTKMKKQTNIQATLFILLLQILPFRYHRGA